MAHEIGVIHDLFQVVVGGEFGRHLHIALYHPHLLLALLRQLVFCSLRLRFAFHFLLSELLDYLDVFLVGPSQLGVLADEGVQNYQFVCNGVD